jgi:hypothetical protein
MTELEKSELMSRALLARARIFKSIEKTSPGRYMPYFREYYPDVDQKLLGQVWNARIANQDYTLMIEKVAAKLEKRFLK